MRNYVLSLIVFLLSTPVFAVDSAGNYAIWGLGTKSCHKYNLARAAGEYEDYRHYVMGYLTAFNHQAEKTYSVSADMTLDEIMIWLDDECQLKPVVSFEESLVGFILENFENRMKSPPGGFGR